MIQPLSHTAIQELLGAFALDAVDADEAAAIDVHLVTCPRCRDEVRDHREVASLLAYGGTAAPDGMWDRVAAALDDAPPAPAAPVLWANRGAGSRTGSRRRRGIAAAALAASVFAGLGAVGGVQVQSALRTQDAQIKKVAGALTEDAARSRLLREAAAAALADGARSAHLVTPGNNAPMADAVVLSDGTGYLLDKGAPLLPGGRTYQLWAVAGGQKISVGVLGGGVDVVTFRAPQSTDALALTDERSPGVVASQNQAVGYGLVKQAPGVVTTRN